MKDRKYMELQLNCEHQLENLTYLNPLKLMRILMAAYVADYVLAIIGEKIKNAE